MIWLCQLRDGFMLGIDKGYVRKVETGYPYPDIDGGQISKISQYLNMDEVNLADFVNEAITLEYPISEINFKNHFYPSRFSLEKENGTLMDLTNELNKFKMKESRQSSNLLLTIKANTLIVNSIDVLVRLKKYFLGNMDAISSYEPNENDLKILSGCQFGVVKRSGLLYIRGYKDDIRKLQGYIDRCYEVIDYDYFIEHEENFSKNMKKEMYILNVEGENNILFFGKSIKGSKIYEFITSLSDKNARCIHHDGHYIIKSDEYNILLEFNSYQFFSLNVGNGNWELIKTKGSF